MFRALLSSRSLLFVVLSLVVIGCSSGPRAAEMTSTLIVSGSHIDVTVEEGKNNVPQPDIIAWVKVAAEAVAGYYGHFPVEHLTLRITPFSGHGVRHGMTFGRHGGFIKIGLGSDTTRTELMDDWMMTHEMIHLAFPSVAEEHHWIEEGISTYVEPLARIRVDNMKEQQMWSDLIRDMPKGEPQPGDEGLDHTHTWGRTYWGGALFCFVADIEIRRQTHNKRGLQDALKGILDAGGNINEDWELTRALEIGDQATGTTVLLDQYNRMKDRPVNVDLQEIWKQLGVQQDGHSALLRDDAPESSIRRGITGSSAPSQETAAPVAKPTAVLAGRRARRLST